jgi:hypothetical protein
VASGNPVYDSRNKCNAIIHSDKHDLIAGCKDTIIPETVKSIGEFSFQGLNGLTSITIPASVEYIGDSAFYDCREMVQAYFYPTDPPGAGSGVFSQCYGIKLAKIYVPNQSLETYKGRNSPWQIYKDIIKGFNP